MAKRFTDTSKWELKWFRNLTPKLKCAWNYLCDRCDHAGIWEIDEITMSHFVGEYVTLSEILESFQKEIVVLPDSRIFIPYFIKFQYGDLNPENRVHRSVISKIENEPILKGYLRALIGSKDKDTDKDKVQEKDKDKEKQNFEKEIEEIYIAKYPRKEGKKKGLERLAKEIKSQDDLGKLEIAITNYNLKLEKDRTETKFIKMFSTFASEWRDFVEPDFSKSQDFSKGPSVEDITAKMDWSE